MLLAKIRLRRSLAPINSRSLPTHRTKHPGLAPSEQRAKAIPPSTLGPTEVSLCAPRSLQGGKDAEGTDLSMHSADDIAAVAAALNTRPRKTLAWQTPAEALDQLLISAMSSDVQN